MIELRGITIKHMADEDPDLSWLETEYDEEAQQVLDSCRYTQKDVDECGWEEVKGWLDGDQKRLDDYNGQQWWMIGIRAVAEIVVGGTIQQINSGGLWGIESDCEASYFEEIARDELHQLREILLALGVTEEQIDAIEPTTEEV